MRGLAVYLVLSHAFHAGKGLSSSPTAAARRPPPHPDHPAPKGATEDLWFTLIARSTLAHASSSSPITLSGSAHNRKPIGGPKLNYSRAATAATRSVSVNPSGFTSANDDITAWKSESVPLSARSRHHGSLLLGVPRLVAAHIAFALDPAGRRARRCQPKPADGTA